jgi:hypothetical protein
MSGTSWQTTSARVTLGLEVLFVNMASISEVWK